MIENQWLSPGNRRVQLNYWEGSLELACLPWPRRNSSILAMAVAPHWTKVFAAGKKFLMRQDDRMWCIKALRHPDDALVI